MNRKELKKANESRECDICHRTVRYYLEDFRVHLCLPKQRIVIENDLFTSYICLKCLMEAIKKEFVEDLKNDKKNGIKMETYKG